ncbi:hypothetical protein NDU88_002743 [Pleurodeles waltl]|uniref:Uncharacterized protein n=1 Tax=Pleurodeles waltl TaxID=8319 RepID=A0AAV7T2V0_PLEWA|nr:hypothetical protein NDU88_002743 [Pleurodeles waltl]
MMHSISYLRQHVREGKQEGETHTEESADTQDAAGQKEEHECRGREDDTLSLEERRSQAGRNGEESLNEGAQGDPNADRAASPSFGTQQPATS